MRSLQRSFLYCSLLLISAALSGCSQKFNDVNDTINLALFGELDTKLAQDEIQDLPYASIYARIADGPQAFMVLALAEPKINLNKHTTPSQQSVQLKWMSSDKGMLVTENGRIVKTLNLPQGNLIETSSSQPDPITLGLHLPLTPTSWQRSIDWQPGYHYGYTLRSEFTRQQNTIILSNDTPIEALHFTETVTASSLDIEYQNDFWLHPITGKVLKSRQKLAPNLPYVEITLLKPYS